MNTNFSGFLLSVFTLLPAANVWSANNADSQISYPINGIPFTQVKISADSFWGERLAASRDVTVPLAFSKCQETNRYTNFQNAAARMKADAAGEEAPYFIPTQFPFDDTDVYKTIEGASYLLQTYPDKQLEAYIDSILDIVAAAQEPDGYLYTARTMNPEHPHSWSGSTRWSNEENGSHELYNLGHMVEAAIAHYQATGSRKFLDIAIKYADCVCRQIGYGKDQVLVVPGHQIPEMALAKLYVATGNRKYLDQAKLFLDNKGKTARKSEYDQSHKPVIEQDQAVGHSGLFLLHGDAKYIDVLERSLYNGVLDGVSLDGGEFFYPNPLESTGGHQRQAWFGCACCPSNICRFIPSVPGYAYAVNGNNLYVNLFMDNTLSTDIKQKSIQIEQKPDYPWNGDISLVLKQAYSRMILKIRIPGWVRGQVVPRTANRNVQADKNRIVVERGPLVYCAEWADNQCNVLSTGISHDAHFTVEDSSISV